MNTTAIVALIRNDIRLYFSDRRAVIVSVLVPVLIAAFFGYVFGGAGRDQEAGKIPIAVVDEDQSAVSRAIIADLTADKMLQVTPLDRAAAREQVQSGKQNAAAVFPAGFGERTTQALFSGQDKPQVELLVDPSQAIGARVIEGLLAQYSMQEISKEAFTGALGRKAIDDYLGALDNLAVTDERNELKTLLQSARRLNERQQAEPARRANPGPAASASASPIPSRRQRSHRARQHPLQQLRHSFAGMSVQFILFAGIDAGILLLLTRQRGIWQRLRSAPLRRGEFMLARALATTLISLFQFAVIYLAAMLVFGVRIEGSWPGFIAVAVAFCLLNAAFGLMLATLGKSAATTRGIAIMVTLLLVMVGGAWVPAFVFPKWLQRRLALCAHPLGRGRPRRRHLARPAARQRAAARRRAAGHRGGCLAIAIWRFRWEE